MPGITNASLNSMETAHLFGRWMIFAGALLVLTGAVLLAVGKIPLLGRLPGDIRIEGKNFSIYIPIATCLVVSLFLSLVFWIFSKLRH